ncbi:zf-HC2 domain-containing protein [Streptomyces capparidis]
MSGRGAGAWKDSPSGPPARRAAGLGRAAAPLPEPAPTPAEQHLGDRLAALVDGELGHDARERVLAHLATCDECRREADEQRRVKETLTAAATAAPGPSAGLLARLQALPGVDRDGGDGPGPFGTDPFPGLGMLAGRSPLDPPERSPLGPAPLPGLERQGLERQGTGFRIHEFAKAARPAAPAATRAVAHRGRRLAFAAAGAFSMAAVALGGALSVEEAPQAGREEPGSSVAPMAGTGQEILLPGRHGGGNGLLQVSESGPPLLVDAMATVSYLPARKTGRLLLPSGRPLPTATPPSAGPPSVGPSAATPFVQRTPTLAAEPNQVP